MAQLFLALSCEEIPARMQKNAGRDLQKLMMTALEEAGLAPSGASHHYGPRHLSLVIEQLSDKQADREIEKRGPRTDAPDKAIDGFCASVGMRRDELVEEETDKGVFYFARKSETGQQAASLLPEMVNDILANFPWPKSQRWGTSRKNWVRPLHRICLMLDDTLIEGAFDLGGDMAIAYSNQTAGHWFHAPDPFTFASATDWQDKMAAHYVMVDAGKRADMIQAQMAEKTANLGIEVIHDDGLLAEVTGLVEWPNVIIGQISDSFMALPEEVLITSMKVHQKYFATRYATGEKAGQLAPYFITVANRISTPETDTLIAHGNERVLRARLADAAFFWDQDKAQALQDYLPALGNVTFYEGLGSVLEKTDRMTNLAGEIANFVEDAKASDAAEGARLAKADLVTGMVGEFPELQGLMGGYYAAHHGHNAAVVAAISDHYKPAGPSDSLPQTPAGLVVSLADKIDTLVGFFGIGAKPTGSKDPFALRRAALAILRMIDECDLRLPLEALCNHAAKEYGFATVDGDLSAFMIDRMTVMLRDQGLGHDVVAAALSDDAFADPRLAMMKARRLSKILATNEGDRLMAGFKRANNILAAEQKKTGQDVSGSIDASLFVAGEETALYDALQAVPADAIADEATLESVMSALTDLADPIDRFFETIIVNDDDMSIRANRLSLLKEVVSQMGKMADFTKIEK
ncbi:MAG: glycine--tRNA ligase subunit beta [Candidatus Puniceispirillaceae bacterium]